ncbi:MAG: 3-dehydroquinate synthase [Candidatus Aminicenantales bacterium]
MKHIRIDSSLGRCTILLEPIQKSLASLHQKSDLAFITDKNIYTYYPNIFIPSRTIILNPGEKSKSLSTMESIYRQFINWKLDRASTVVGIGGGVVGDITGFAASTFMRGLQFILVPTTLVAQADSSIGGKNSLNFKGYKNIVGTFCQPQFIMLDFNFLHTLPQSEIQNGIAEIIKHVIIASSSFFNYLEQNSGHLESLSPQVVKKSVLESIRIKSSIVKVDPKESNQRRKLNFGHTLAHALEKTIHLPHGIAVVAGMAFAVRASYRLGFLSANHSARILAFFQRLCLLSLPSFFPSKKSLMEAIWRDKKKEGEFIHFVFLSKIGRALIKKISYSQLKELIYDLC